MASKSLTKTSDTSVLNVQAYIRVRPLHEKEKINSSLEFTKKEVTIKSASETTKTSRTLTFDRVFLDDAKQVTVFDTVVRPMIKEVLQGYNCTIFAYGQTGTGKTYTMTGYSDESTAEVDDLHVGIIPRAMAQIFEELGRITAEYQVSISYVELYNEKLGSLLTDDTNIQLIDDSQGGVILRGLSPIVVKSKDEACKLLKEGTAKKQMASTLLNENSSRSHTIFSVKVVIKETLLEGKDDVVRIGKLHLVDLAGSENVSKSGASEAIHKIAGGGVNKRLAEASNINKSLLTLGRVITSIIENNPHIPYRESKLTRFLRDSLGGKTKTCIIGTISPAHCNLDETENTLNYTCKTRSIKNKPERNQKISQKEFMQVATEEILKLKRDLEAVRQGDGFFVSKETHETMNLNLKHLQGEVRKWNEKYNAIQASYDQMKETFDGLNIDYEDRCSEIAELETLIEGLRSSLEDQRREIFLREYLIYQYNQTESSLTEQAKTCKTVLENLIDQNNRLHDVVERKEKCETENVTKFDEFKDQMFSKLQKFEGDLEEMFGEQAAQALSANDFASGITNYMVVNLNRVIESLKSLQNRVMGFYSDYFKEEEEKRTREIVAEASRLGNDFINVFEIRQRYLYESYVNLLQPGMKSLNESLEKVLETVESGKRHLNKVMNSDGNELAAKYSQLLVQVEEIKTLFNGAVFVFNRELKDARALAEQTHESTVQCYQDMQQLNTLVAKLTESANSTQILAYNAKEKLELTKQVVEKVKDEVGDKLENITQQSSELLKNLSQHQGEVSIANEAITKQVKVRIGEMAKDGATVMNNLYVDIEIDRQAMQTAQKMVKQEVWKFASCAARQGEEIGLRMKAWGDVTGMNSKNIAADVMYLASDFDQCMEEESVRSTNRKRQMTSIYDHCNEFIGEMCADSDETRLVRDAHTGNTPPRVNQESLDYPRQFVASQPRNLLRDSFYSGTEDHISRLGLSIGELQLCGDSSTDQRPAIRRSWSVPNNIETLVPSEEEDKENATPLEKRPRKLPNKIKAKSSMSAGGNTNFRRPLAPRKTKN